MKKQFLILIVIALVVIMPVIYAETISDAVQQQIAINTANAAYGYDFEGKTPIEILAENPQFRQAFAKIIIIFVIVAILFVIDIILRGVTMWKASKRNQKTWFWFLLVVNSLCILPIIYLIIYRGKKDKKK